MRLSHLFAIVFACGLNVGTAQATLISGELPIHIDAFYPGFGGNFCDQNPDVCVDGTFSWSFDTRHPETTLTYDVEPNYFADFHQGPAGYLNLFGGKVFNSTDTTDILDWINDPNDGVAVVIDGGVTASWKPHKNVLSLYSNASLCFGFNDGVNFPCEEQDILEAGITGGSWILGAPADGDSEEIDWSTNLSASVPEPSPIAVFASGLIVVLAFGSTRKRRNETQNQSLPV